MINKNMTIALVSSVLFVSPIFARDARTIRKDLQEKYVQGVLNECQLVEDDLTFLEVLDRDIHIMEDHKKTLRLQISICKGLFMRSVVPFFKLMSACIMAGILQGRVFLPLLVAFGLMNCGKEKEIFE